MQAKSVSKYVPASTLDYINYIKITINTTDEADY